MTFVARPRAPYDPPLINPWSWNAIGGRHRGQATTTPSSGTGSATGLTFYPFTLARPYDLQRFYWANGSTVGTDSLTPTVYSTDGGWEPDCIVVGGPRTLSAGASANQYATCAVLAHPLTSGTNTTDATSFVTASVTMKARPGLVYLLAVVNTHGSSANTVTAATTGGAASFTSEKTVQFNGTLSRNTLFRLVPTADVTDTITITIGSAQTATACLWSLVAFSNVDTTTNMGVVQSVSNTGSSTTPSVTLAAFGSANNATYGAHGTAQTAATPGTGFIEIHDVTASTPTCGLETEYRSDNDTGVDATITSAQWGSIAAELKSLGTTAVLGPGPYWFGLHLSGVTATVLRVSSGQTSTNAGIFFMSSGVSVNTPLTPVFATSSGSAIIPLAGITSRSTP